MINCPDGETLCLEKVLYTSKLKANILSLGKLDKQGYRFVLEIGFLTIYDPQRRLLTRVKKSFSRLYPLKLSVVEECFAANEGAEVTWT